MRENLYSGRSIDKIDFDQDGDWDLIIGNRIIPQHYPSLQHLQLFLKIMMVF